MSLEKEVREIAQNGMISIENNFNSQNWVENRTEGGSSESEHFAQEKIALIKTANMIRKTSREEKNIVAVHFLEFLKTSVLQSSDYCEGLRTLDMYSELCESSTCEKPAGFDMKPSMVSTTTENGTERKHIFLLKDTGNVI